MDLENELTLAQQKREEDLLDTYIEEQLEVLLAARTVGPEARRKLGGLLKYYSKKKQLKDRTIWKLLNQKLPNYKSK